jgi:hypothetical protein
MIFHIVHHTSYIFDGEVFLEPHHLYFHPSARSHMKVNSFDIEINPSPSGLAQRLDAENNIYHQCWFNHQVKQLDIKIEMTVETWEVNPFNFLVEESYLRDHTPSLQIFLTKQHLSIDQKDWLAQMQNLAGDDLVTFITFLNKEIFAAWEHQGNHSTKIISPSECFALKKGSCRDLAWMLVQLLRNVQIPARFVSGYTFNTSLEVDHELHAWAEAWLPGAGWIGLDPTAGLLTTNNYIPVSTSYIPENTLPVQGNLVSDTAYEYTYEVNIAQLD